VDLKGIKVAGGHLHPVVVWKDEIISIPIKKEAGFSCFVKSHLVAMLFGSPKRPIRLNSPRTTAHTTS
jgi:hypothetical protein